MHLTRSSSLLTVAALAALPACEAGTRTAISCAGKGVLAASGSSAQVEAMDQFNTVYARACRGRTVDYTSNGSAMGRSEFINGQTDFGGSDSPLGLTAGDTEKARARCGGHDAWNLPLVFGAVAIIYNLAGHDALVLDAPTAAKIFNGSINAWDAPEIAALNRHRSPGPWGS